MKKIVLLSCLEHTPWGGSEELWAQSAAHLQRNGYKVHTSIKQWPTLPNKVKELHNLGVEFHFRKAIPPLNFIQRQFKKLDSRLGRIEKNPFQQHLEMMSPPWVLISQGAISDGLEWMKHCIYLNIPFATVCQAASESWWLDDSKAEQLSSCLSQAKMNFYVSHHNKQLVETMIAKTLPNAKVISNPVNTTICENIPWPDNNQEIQLACVGRLEPIAKGQDIILKVLAMDKWRERPLKVNFYGKGTNELHLKKLSETLHLESVQFCGYKGNIADILSNNHALILASRYEGLPLTLIEAMTMGRSAIVTDVGGNSEVITHRKTGYIAKAPTVELMDTALEEMWQNRHNLQAMGQEAAEHIKKTIPPDPISLFCNELLSVME